MAVREVVTDPKTGKRVQVTVPGYEDKLKVTAKPSKESTMKTNGAKPKPSLKEQLKGSKNAAQKGVRVEKKALKATIMALNEDNVYSKKSQVEMDDDSQLIQAFTRWVKSGNTGEFFAIRRK